MERRIGGKTVMAPKPAGEVAALVTIITRLKPDILGLIEMGDESTLLDLQGRLKEAGLDLPHREWVRGADEARHLALLSRFPIVQRNSQDDLSFPLDGKVGRVLRGLLDVTIAIESDYRLRLVGAHLKSRRDVPGLDQAKLRLAEARILSRHARAILASAPETNLLVYGDLNDTKNEPPIRELLSGPNESRLRDLWVKDSRGETWTHYWRIADSYSRIDYLLYSRGLSRELNRQRSGIYDQPNWPEASDHRPIYTAITPVNR